MLQARHLSQLLSQSLQPIPVQSTSNTRNGSSYHKDTGPGGGIAPFAISLLSNEGIPLTTVFNHNHHYQHNHQRGEAEGRESVTNHDVGDRSSGSGYVSPFEDQVEEEGYNSDNLKIYSLIGYKQLEVNLVNEDDTRLGDWDIIQIEEGLKLIIQRVKYGDGSDNVGEDIEANGGPLNENGNGNTNNTINGIEHRERIADDEGRGGNAGDEDDDDEDDDEIEVNHIDDVEGKSGNYNQLFVVLYYSTEFPDFIAKLKIDNLSKALSEGLQGCNVI